MLFNSWDFWLAFAALYAAYRLLPRVGQNLLLLAFSAVFYGYWDWRFLGLLWWSTFEDYYCGLRIHNSRDPAVRARFLALSVVGNVGLLAAFKYCGFFVDSLSAALGSLGVQASLPALRLAVPVGLSFYTFQTLGYTLDVYRGKQAPARSFLDFALFVSFFPQLIAGPIEKASRLLPQIESERRVTRELATRGVWLCFWGLFQKCVVADNLARLVDPVYAPGASPGAGAAVLAFYGFALQIYCDFSGYSDLARGLGALLGFELSVNFRLPLFASGPRDFWRRWHLTLSDWFRENVYVPLGGGRGGTALKRRNLLLTFLLMGLWHGAGWNYVAFGLLWGIAAALEDALAPRPPRGTLERAARAVLMLHVFVLAAAVFRVRTLDSAAALLRSLALPWSPPPPGQLRLFLAATAPFLAVELLRWPDQDAESVLRRPRLLKAPLYALLGAWFVWLSRDGGKEYVYFQF